MLDLIIAALVIVATFIVLLGTAVGVMLLWAVDHSQRTRYSAERRGGRHGPKNKF